MSESDSEEDPVGNWKMYSPGHGRRAGEAMVETAGTDDRVTVVLCPPFLPGPGREVLTGSKVLLGAQNVYLGKEGVHRRVMR
jgi:triosephosphate isomerase